MNGPGHLLRPEFWLAALFALVLMESPWPARPMQRFGALNLLALAAVCGWRATLAAALVTAAAWALLRLAARPGGTPSAPAVGAVRAWAWPLLVALAVLVFAAHKLHLEGRTGGFAERPLDLVARLAWSYAFLRLLDAARSVAGGARLIDPLGLIGFLFPFHMLVAGPINVYAEHLEADAAARPGLRWPALVGGLDTVTTGLFYKLVLAEGLRIFAFGLEGPLRSAGLLDSALLFVYLFFDFAGYSLVALGLGRLLGVPTPVNFDRPFQSSSLTEFWQRWHASLGRFVRAHLFLPLQVRLVRAWGVPRAYGAGLLVLVVSFGFVGLWHRLHARFLLWGLGMGALLALEKLVRDRCLRHAWARRPLAARLVRGLGPLYVFAVLALSLHPLWGLLL